MTAVAFEEAGAKSVEDGWATWATLGAMGLAAAAMFAWQSVAIPGVAAPEIAVNAQDCASCHAGAAVLASVTQTHADVGLDLALLTRSQAVHSTQDCASCHTTR